MGIVSVKEINGQRSSSITADGRTYSRVFQVLMDDPTDGPLLARSAPGIAINDTYVTTTESDSDSICTSVSSSCVSADFLTWEVSAEYSPKPDNPLTASADVKWSFAQFERTTERDINGTAILNSADDPFAEAVVIDDSRPVLSVTKNVSSFSPSLAFYYRDATNSTSFYGAGTEQVKVSNISATYVVDDFWGGYWQLSFEFAFDPQKFTKKILDQGYRYVDPEDGKKKNILVQGQPVNDPHLLDGDGNKLDSGGSPVFKTFSVYPKLPFSVFGI